MNSNHAEELARATELLADHCREGPMNAGKTLSMVMGVQSLLFQMEPITFLQHAAYQSQVIACLHWLGKFQVLAYLPLDSEQGLAVQDLAELADVPAEVLSRVTALMSSCQFLSVPTIGFVAHTPLSANFVQRPAQLDAAMFLCETAVPASLKMTSNEFPALRVDWENPRVQRLWPRFFVSAMGGAAHDSEILELLDWAGMEPRISPSTPSSSFQSLGGGISGGGVGGGGRGRVVMVGHNADDAGFRQLALEHPKLHFILQSSSGHNTADTIKRGNKNLQSSDVSEISNVTLCQRNPGTPQSIKDANCYLVSATNNLTTTTTLIQVRAELQAHLSVLRANRAAVLILTSTVATPLTTGPVLPYAIPLTQVRDLQLLQITGTPYLTLPDLLDTVKSVQDGHGGLTVVKQLHTANSTLLGLGIRYQSI
ncbi:unnamed protein product [Periconia digitata]|uniref:Uncharacterized protein n=1 Tax=Periconia digitata TaxID=1303443 RepID=A0A9W4XHD7_9PLEO|nr:unnamed protein product [Periconia digitata]